MNFIDIHLSQPLRGSSRPPPQPLPTEADDHDEADDVDAFEDLGAESGSESDEDVAATPSVQRFDVSLDAPRPRPPRRAAAVRLRPRPPGDVVLTEDDVVTASDVAAGLRRHAPAAPDASGSFMAMARRRYEREQPGEVLIEFHVMQMCFYMRFSMNFGPDLQ